MPYNYLYRYLWILFFNYCSITNFLGQNCTSTTADIRYTGTENNYITGNTYHQDWSLRNYTSCTVQNFRIEEFPEVYKQATGGNWVLDPTPVTNINNPQFSLTGPNATGTAEVSFQFTPSTSGTYRIFFRIKDQYNTTLNDICTNYPNRCRLYAQITVGNPNGLPNLRISNTNVPSSSTAGSAVTIACDIQNNGTSIANTSSCGFWYSEDPSINPYGSTYLGQNTVQSISLGSSVGESKVVRIPSNASAGTRYFCFEADANNVLVETSESDNVSCIPFTIVAPLYHDLTTTNESISPNAVTQGGNFTASCDAQYTGSGSANSRVAVYLSSGNTLTTASIFVGTFNTMTLSSSYNSTSLSRAFSLPPNIALGTYNVLFVSDYGNNVNEGVSGEQNNVRSVGNLQVTFSQDLTVINPYISTTLVMQGGTMNMGCTHNYVGNLPYDQLSRVGCYLATTPNMSGVVHNFGTRSTWMGFTSQQSVYLYNQTIPQVANGTYYIIFQADQNNDFIETNENNNIIASVPFTISNIPPSVDVTVSNIQPNAGRTDFYGGGRVSIAADQHYIGPGSVKPYLEFFLSKTTSLSSNSISIGKREQFGYLSSSNSSGATTVFCDLPNDISPGSYYLIAYADAENDVTETHENNNTQVYAQQIRVLPSFSLSYDSDFLAADHLCTKIGDPVNAATGEFLQQQIDMELYSFGQVFPWRRSYRSNSGYNGDLGHGWTHSYDIHLTVSPERWTIHYGDGHEEPFVEYHDGSTYPMYWHMKDTIGRNPDSSYTLIKPNGVVYTFYKNGKIGSIKNEANVGLIFTYNGTELSKVNLPGGRYYDLSYQNGRISSVTDNSGRSVSYQYDSNGNLITYTNTRGGTFQYVYDTQNRIVSITDPKGITFVQNIYDGNGKVIEQRDANNNVSTFQYTQSSRYSNTTYTNPLGEIEEYSFLNQTQRLYCYKDPNGNWKDFSYGRGHLIDLKSVIDQEGNQYSVDFQYHHYTDRYKVWKPTQIYNPLNERMSIEYGFKNLPVAFINVNGDTTSISYDSIRNPIQVTYPNGAQINSTYNTLGQLITRTDPNGNVISYSYDVKGDLVTVTTASGSYAFQYDQVGRMIAVTDRNGKTIQTSFDPYGNILSVTDAMGFTVWASYDANGNLDTLIDKNGNATIFAYDAMDRIVAVTNALGQQTSYTYNAANRLIQTTDPNGSTIDYTYNSMGWLTSKTNALGTWSYGYNKIGNVISVTDALNNTVSTTTYDKLSRPVTIQNALGNTSSVVYDRVNRKITAIDANNHPTVYQYDKVGQLTHVTDAAGGQNVMTYDLNGNMQSMTDANGHTITYNGYNHHNLPSSMSYPGGYTTNYQYGNEGNIIQKTDANGLTTNITYDNNYRITNLNYSNGESEIFTYNDAGALLSMVNSNGATTLIRDLLDRAVSTTDPFGNSVHYGFDQVGNNTHIIYPSGDTVHMTYNAVGLQTQVRDWLGNYTNRTYDANGQLSSILNSNGTSTSITRDALGRITAYDNYLGTGARFYSDSLFYDANNNIINIISDDLLQPNFVTSTHSYRHGSDDRITNSPLGTHTHDAKGAISSINGATNPTYTFGENDVLKQYTINGQTTQILSNPLNQAISKTRNGVKTDYVYSNIESDLYTAIQEFDATNNAQKSNIYAADGLGWSLDSVGNASFLTYNYLGHTKALTNTAGDTTDIYAYGPFGDFFAHRGTNTQQHTFLGKYGIYHEDNDFFHIRARYYDAANGRFVSKDKAALENGSTQRVNRYTYTANKPFGAVDVNGYNQEVLHCPDLSNQFYEYASAYSINGNQASEIYSKLIARSYSLDFEQTNNVKLITRQYMNQAKIFNIDHLSYILATTYHESKFKPIKEKRAYPSQKEVYEDQNEYWYTGYYGRGFVQLTWEDNYTTYSNITGLDLVGNPDLVLDPDISSFILVHGMLNGSFTNKSLHTYTDNMGQLNFINARRTILGLNKANLIADNAKFIKKDLTSYISRRIW